MERGGPELEDTHWFVSVFSAARRSARGWMVPSGSEPAGVDGRLRKAARDGMRHVVELHTDLLHRHANGTTAGSGQVLDKRGGGGGGLVVLIVQVRAWWRLLRM